MDSHNLDFTKNVSINLTRLTEAEIKKYTRKNHKKDNQFKLLIGRNTLSGLIKEDDGGAIQHTQLQIKDEVEDIDVVEIKTEQEDQTITITKGIIFPNYIENVNGNEFICKKCNVTFDNFEETVVHKNLNHRSKPYKCKVCNLQFVLGEHLRLHQTEHDHDQIQSKDDVEDIDVVEIKTEQEDQIIPITKGTTFSNNKENFNGNENICKMCNATFDNFEETVVHKNLNHRSKPYKCKVCNLQFVLGGHLRLHQTEHDHDQLQSKDDVEDIDVVEIKTEQEDQIIPITKAKHDHNPCMRNSSVNPSEIQSSSKSNLTISPSKNYKNIGIGKKILQY